MIMTCKVLMFKINRRADMPERIPPTCHYWFGIQFRKGKMIYVRLSETK